MVDPKKVLLLIEPPKSAQTLKKRSKTQKVYPTKGLPEKSATMEAPGIAIYIMWLGNSIRTSAGFRGAPIYPFPGLLLAAFNYFASAVA